MDPYKFLLCCGLLIQFTSALPLDSSKPQSSQFIERHACTPIAINSSDDGFVPYTVTKYSCSKGLTPSLYMDATCEKRCRDPVKNKYLSKKLYKMEPVTYFKRFESKFDGTVDRELTLSCRCVATEKGKRKSRAREKKRRQRSRQ